MKSGLLDRLKNTRERALEKVLETDLGKSQSEALSRIIGIDRKVGKEHLSDVVVTDSDGLLKVDFAKRILKWMAEAVGRNLEFSPAADTYVRSPMSTDTLLMLPSPKDVNAQMNILIEHLRNMYLEVALDA